MQKKIFDFLSYIIIKNSYILVCGISIIGLFSSFYYGLMDKDTWFWFFSTTAQTFAALIALAAVFSIFNLESYNLQIHSKFDYLRPIIKNIIDEDTYYTTTSDKLLEESFDDIRLRLDPYVTDVFDKIRNEISDIEQKKEKFKNKFSKLFASSLIIVIYSLMFLPLGSVNLHILDFFELKWFLIYLAVGHCIVVLSQLALRLSEFFNEDE